MDNITEDELEEACINYHGPVAWKSYGDSFREVVRSRMLTALKRFRGPAPTVLEETVEAHKAARSQEERIFLTRVIQELKRLDEIDRVFK